MDAATDALATTAPSPRRAAHDLIDGEGSGTFDPLTIRRDGPHPTNRACGALCTPWCAAGW